MDIKIEIKEEKVILSDLGSQNKQELISKKFDTETNRYATDNREFDMKSEIKMEALLSDFCSKKDGRLFTEHLGKPLKSPAAIGSNNGKMNTKAEIEEMNVVLDFAAQNKRIIFSEGPVEKCNNDFEIPNKMEVKEENWWLETSSVETIPVYDDIKEGMYKDFTPVNAPRIHVKADSNDGNCPPASFSSNILQNEASFNTGKDRPECQEAGNFKTESLLVENRAYSKEISFGNYCKKNCSIFSYLKQSILIEKNNRKQELYLASLNSNHTCRKLHKCDICQTDFSSLSSLKTHNLIHEGKKPFKCQLCEKNFRTLSHLKTHNLVHEGKKPYKCKICNMNFRHSSHLKKHNLIHEGKKPFKCEICDKHFRSLSDLKRHNLVHLDKKQFKCEICRKDFNDMSNLKEHNLIHVGKKPFNCKICHKDFSKLSNLKTHNLIHEDIKPFKCEICEMDFRTSSHLKRHSLIHEGKKPFKCDICDRKFSQLSSLKTHSFIHEGKKPYKCEVCHKDFRSSSNLKTHNLIHERKKKKAIEV